MVAVEFFYTGPVGGGSLSVEQVILDCYRLARRYSRDPDEFLNKPLSIIRRHIAWTGRLIQEEAAAREADDAS